MNHPLLRSGYLAILLAAALLPASGCRNALATAVYLVKGNNIEPEYDGLRGKRVAVVCRPVVDLKYRNASVAKQLARQMSILLEERVPRIEVVDHRKVAAWIDENGGWDEYTEVGEALDADMVLGVDLQEFTVYADQTLCQGRANTTISVYDCADGSQPVFEKELPQTVYPPNAVIPTSEKPEAEFRKEFVAVLADQIGRHFYAHDPHADYALDATVMD
jgi:hypothetical protein